MQNTWIHGYRDGLLIGLMKFPLRVWIFECFKKKFLIVIIIFYDNLLFNFINVFGVYLYLIML